MGKERLRVLDRRIYVDIWDLFYGRTIDDVKSKLDAIHIVDYGRAEDAKFVVEYVGYEGVQEVTIEVYRDETDSEYNKRIAKEAAEKERKRIASEKKKEKARQALMESEAAERAEYERLKAKFSNVN